MDYEQMKVVSDTHLRDPQPGDYWHEMFSPVCVVLEVLPHCIVLCRKIQALPQDKWTWNLAQRETMSRTEFKKWLSYSHSVPGTWAQVIPRHHAWACATGAPEQLSFDFAHSSSR